MTALDTTKGDAEFTAFMGQVAPSLLRTAWLLTGDPDRAQDLVQAALVKTYQAWPRVRHEDALAYTRRVLVNHRTDVWRRSRHEVASPGLPEGVAAEAGSSVELRDELVRQLHRLPTQQRRVIVLRYYGDLSERAVAELLDVSVGAVKSAASRGLAVLRARQATASSTEGKPR